MKNNLFFGTMLLLVACGSPDTEQENPVLSSVQESLPEPVTVTDTAIQPVAPKIDTSLLPLSRKILKLVKDKDLPALARHVHPEKGVRFAPYAYIDTNASIHLGAKELEKVSHTRKFTWGHANGSGELIHLSIPAYFDRYVYDADFLENAHISQNDFLGKGNSLNNLKEMYPGCSFTEFHFKGSIAQDGTDWKSVRLVFETLEGQPYLVAVVHDERTI